MRLSELVALIGDDDPQMMVEDEDGNPRRVVDVDLGVMLTPAGRATYVLLEPARNGDDR